MKTRICLLYILLILSCKKGNDFFPVYNVLPEFEPYVKTFVSEAAARGNTITINNLIIQYDSSLSDLYCAVSNVISAQNDVQKIISVNPRLKCWQNNAQLETLIFHEMGHCILGRDHDESLLPNGSAKSIMFPDDLTLYSPCVYPIGDSCEQYYKRTYYVDELFDPSTPVPDWGK